MFTGIIETIGKIVSASPKPGGMTLTVQFTPEKRALVRSADKQVAPVPAFPDDIHLGDSIAVNGTCLTVIDLSGPNAKFDVSAETLTRSTLKTVRSGRLVNLERAMSASARFGGHIVQGHVDGIGKIVSIQKQTDFAVFTIEPPKELLDQIVTKGSIALDGISLTVASITGKAFTVALIPETLSRTIWKDAKPGDAVNIETDILLKAVQKQLDKIKPADSGLTEQKLRDLGF